MCKSSFVKTIEIDVSCDRWTVTTATVTINYVQAMCGPQCEIECNSTLFRTGTKILHLYGLNAIRILFLRGEILQSTGDS